MRSMRGVLITALATGSVFVVLSVLVERTQAIVRSSAEDPEEAGHFVDVVLPVAFTFPSAGKLLSLGFVLFAGWVAGYALSASQYPMLVGAGVPSYFGATVAAIPFLLDLFQIPADTFQLFLVADNMVGTRFGAMLGAMHLVAMGFIATAAMTGKLVIRPVALARYAVVTVALTLAVLVGVRSLFEWMGHEYAGYDRFVSMGTRFAYPPMTVLDAPPEPDAVSRPGEDSVQRIVGRGTLRVGYTRDRLPWAFRNAEGALVGFDVEMARILAQELGVGLEIAPVDSPGLVDDLAAGRVDVLMSGLALTTSRLRDVSFSTPYVDETIAFIVRDHRRQDFGSRATVRALPDPHIAVPDVPYYIDKLRRYLPEARLTKITSPRQFFVAEEGEFDALLFTAESGSAWSLIFPQFTVAVPRPDILKVPLAYAVRRGDERLVELLSAWIELKRRDGTIDELFEHYVLGRMPEAHEKRWSVWRDVLGRD
jgi:ABC-type amino acid transport substrate-binding protein